MPSAPPALAPRGSCASLNACGAARSGVLSTSSRRVSHIQGELPSPSWLRLRPQASRLAHPHARAHSPWCSCAGLSACSLSAPPQRATPSLTCAVLVRRRCACWCSTREHDGSLRAPARPRCDPVQRAQPSGILFVLRPVLPLDGLLGLCRGGLRQPLPRPRMEVADVLVRHSRAEVRGDDGQGHTQVCPGCACRDVCPCRDCDCTRRHAQDARRLVRPAR